MGGYTNTRMLLFLRVYGISVQTFAAFLGDHAFSCSVLSAPPSVQILHVQPVQRRIARQKSPLFRLLMPSSETPIFTPLMLLASDMWPITLYRVAINCAVSTQSLLTIGLPSLQRQRHVIIYI